MKKDKDMNGSFFIGLLAVCVIAGAVLYKMRGNAPSFHKPFNLPTGIPVETVEGELSMDSVVAYFRAINLNAKEDVPFITKDMKLTFGTNEYTEKDGYKTLFLGVFSEEKDAIKNAKIIYAKNFDAKLEEVLSHASKDGIVVLN